MHTLEMFGTNAQKERWLEPLARGEIKSGFSMTEPRQGAGSDPKMIRTANVTQEIIDDCLQLCGGSGISRHLPLSNFYENVRQFRIIDGADEVHKRVIARDAFENVDETELEASPRFDA